MSQTNINSAELNFNNEDRKLFDASQHKHWKNIEIVYQKLQTRCLTTIDLPQTGTHKEWIKSRVNLHVSQSLMRLLYLAEEFCHSAKTFNAVSAAALVKAMTEIPLHLGYVAWVLNNHNDFEAVRAELHKIAFGNRDQESGLTTSSKITHKELYTRADEMVKKIFKDDPSTINIFERLYKDANATGHHNYEARMLTGIQNGDTWKAGDRKELFVFFSNNIFQFFLYCDTVLSMSDIFLKALDHYLNHLPTFYPNEDLLLKGKQKFLEIQGKLKRLSDEMFKVVQAYYLWQAIVFSRSIPEIGKKLAEKNAQIMNKYKTFFMQTENSHVHTFIVGISKFFDRNPKSLSIQHIINEIEVNKDKITPEVILEVYPSRFNKDEISGNYSPYDERDVEEINILREKYNYVIQQLKKIRDKEIAHIDIEVVKGSFIPKEVEELIIAIQKMFNKLSSRFDRSETRWDHLKEAAINETRLMLENLERGEKQRMSDIKSDFKKKWGVELK